MPAYAEIPTTSSSCCSSITRSRTTPRSLAEGRADLRRRRGLRDPRRPAPRTSRCFRPTTFSHWVDDPFTGEQTQAELRRAVPAPVPAIQGAARADQERHAARHRAVPDRRPPRRAARAERLHRRAAGRDRRRRAEEPRPRRPRDEEQGASSIIEESRRQRAQQADGGRAGGAEGAQRHPRGGRQAARSERRTAKKDSEFDGMIARAAARVHHRPTPARRRMGTCQPQDAGADGDRTHGRTRQPEHDTAVGGEGCLRGGRRSAADSRCSPTSPATAPCRRCCRSPTRWRSASPTTPATGPS